MQETQVRSLGQEDPLEKGMATHSSILAWRIPWAEEPVSYSPWGCNEFYTTKWLSVPHTHSCFTWLWFGEGELAQRGKNCLSWRSLAREGSVKTNNTGFFYFLVNTAAEKFLMDPKAWSSVMNAVTSGHLKWVLFLFLKKERDLDNILKAHIISRTEFCVHLWLLSYRGTTTVSGKPQ